MHRPETKIETEVKILCSKPSQQTESMKTNAEGHCETILCLLLAPSVE
jgi:hypothetical protein